MPAPTNRREDLLDAAIEAFVDRGYEGTSVADLTGATGLSKAAFVYHFQSKEALLFELAGPLLDDLDEVADRHERRAEAADGHRALLEDYLGVLCAHRRAVEWLDGDKSILNHGDLGARLDANNRRFHQLLIRGQPDRISRAQASAVLGMLWRPMRNGYMETDGQSRRAVLELALGAAEMLSES